VATGSSLPSLREKKGGIEGDDDREGLGWPPRELALRFVLPEHQPTTIPPFLRKARGHEEEGKKTTRGKGISSVATGSQGEASNREQASPTPCLRKKGGTAGDGDREGLGWPPRELALLFVLPEHQSTTIPPLLRKKLGAERKKGRKQHERERDIRRMYVGEAQTENKLPHPRASAKRGGTAGDDDREGLGWPPSELALLFVLPEHQSTTIPPFLRKAQGRKARREENNMEARDIRRGYRLTRGGSNREQASQTPRLREKGGAAGDGDREGLGWPPWELALLFVLPEHQSTTIPPLLRKAKAKRKKGRKQHQRNKDPKKR